MSRPSGGRGYAGSSRAAGVDVVLRVQSHLTDRDHTLIGWLGDHGVLTSAQIAYALFPSLDFAQRRLQTLHRLGLLDRFRPLKMDGGSYPYHYVLAQLGAQVLAAQRGEDPPRPGQARQRMRALTSRANLGHLLGANQFFTDLAGYAREHPPDRLERWWSEAHCGQAGVFRIGLITAIRPDGHGIYSQPAHEGRPERRVGFFLEYDTGTEPLNRLIDKLPAYRRFATESGHRWPVLFWLHSPTRERNLHERLAQQAINVPVATASRTGRNPAEPVWWLHRQPGGLLRLIDLPDAAESGR